MQFQSNCKNDILKTLDWAVLLCIKRSLAIYTQYHMDVGTDATKLDVSASRNYFTKQAIRR